MAPLRESLRGLRRRLFVSEAAQIAKANIIPPLPPTPSVAVVSAPLPSATSESVLFKRLPPEIRRRILIAAFGDDVVHMHLALERPMMKQYKDQDRSLVHAKLPADDTWDKTKPPYWLWRSSVCHSFCFFHSDWQNKEPRELEWQWTMPHMEDDCVSDGVRCQRSKGSPVADCFLGITGWLLTCRRAYEEGIDVLYRTNTIRLRGTFMFSNLPQLIPKFSRDNITMVSLFWDLGHREWGKRAVKIGRHPENFNGIEDFKKLLALLPETLPNAKNLQLSLNGRLSLDQFKSWGRRSALGYEATEALCRTILASVLQLQKLADFRLALPSSLFMPWIQEATDVTIEFDEPVLAILPDQWLWRDIPAEFGTKAETKRSLDGFWVLEGLSDLPVLDTPCFRF